MQKNCWIIFFPHINLIKKQQSTLIWVTIFDEIQSLEISLWVFFFLYDIIFIISYKNENSLLLSDGHMHAIIGRMLRFGNYRFSLKTNLDSKRLPNKFLRNFFKLQINRIFTLIKFLQKLTIEHKFEIKLAK